MRFSSPAYRRLNTFEITYKLGEMVVPQQMTSPQPEPVDGQATVEAGDNAMPEAALSTTQPTSPDTTNLSDRLRGLGLIVDDPLQSVKFYTTSEFNIQFTPQQQDLIGVTFGSMNKLAGIMGSSFIIDFPQALLYSGMEAVSWSMDAFLSIYESPNHEDEIGSLEEAVYNRYALPLATMLAIILPYRTENKASLTGTLKQIVDMLSNIAPNLFSSSFMQDVQATAEKGSNFVDQFLTQASKGTVFEAFMTNSYYVAPPLQYSIQSSPAAGLGMGIGFKYGPVDIDNVIIKSMKLSFGNLVFRTKEGVGIPEMIKVHFDFTTQYKPSIDMMAKTFGHLKAQGV